MGRTGDILKEKQRQQSGGGSRTQAALAEKGIPQSGASLLLTDPAALGRANALGTGFAGKSAGGGGVTPGSAAGALSARTEAALRQAAAEKIQFASSPSGGENEPYLPVSRMIEESNARGRYNAARNALNTVNPALDTARLDAAREQLDRLGVAPGLPSAQEGYLSISSPSGGGNGQYLPVSRAIEVSNALGALNAVTGAEEERRRRLETQLESAARDMQRLGIAGTRPTPTVTEQAEAARIAGRLAELRPQTQAKRNAARSRTLDADTRARLNAEADAEEAAVNAEIAELERQMTALGYDPNNTADDVLRSGAGGAMTAAKGIANELGYFGQNYAKGMAARNAAANAQAAATLNILSKLWDGTEYHGMDAAVEQSRAAADAALNRPLETWFHWGDAYNAETARRTQFVGPVGKAVNNVASGVGGMVPSIAANLLVPGAGMPVLFTQAAGNATEEALNAGASDARAVMYGAAVGAVEVFTEKMFGGMPGLGDGWVNTAIAKGANPAAARLAGGGVEGVIERAVKNSVRSEAAQTAWLMLVNALGEGFEEFASEVMDEFISRGLMPDYQARNTAELLGDAGYSFLIGALTSSVMQLPAATVNAMRGQSPREAARTFAEATQETGAMFQNMGPEAVDAIVAEGLQSAAGTESRALAEEAQRKLNRGKTLTGGEIGRLYAANVEAIEAENAVTAANPSPEGRSPGQEDMDAAGTRGRVMGALGAREVNRYAKEQFDGGQIGKQGSYALSAFYDGNGDAIPYINQMTRSYNAGREGLALDETAETPALNDAQRRAAWQAGVDDAAETAVHDALESAVRPRRDDAAGNNERTPTAARRVPSRDNVSESDTTLTEDKSDAREIVAKLQSSIPSLQAEPISATLSGTEFPKSGGKLTDQVGEFFRRLGNTVFRSGLGNVILDKRGVKSDIAHGVGRAKAITFAAVPDVISRGQQIDHQKNWKGRGYDTYVFAAPVNLAGETTYVAAVVRSGEDNRFYLHEVVDQNGKLIYKTDVPAAIKTGVTVQDGVTGTAGTPTEDATDGRVSQTGTVDTVASSDQTIPQSARAVNNQTNQEVRNHGEEEGAASGGGVEQRAPGVSAEKRSGGVQSRAGESEKRRAAQRRGAAGIRDSVNAAGVREVSTRSQGLADGTDRAAMKVVPSELWTGEMRKAYREQEQKGVHVTYFTGSMEFSDARRGTFKASGMLTADGKRMWVKADSDLYSAGQLIQHEEFHRLARQDAGLTERLRAELTERYGETQLKELVDAYVNEYGWTNLTDAEIFEEILADAYAGIDIFDYLWTYEGATRFDEAVRESAEQDATTETESIRGPPEAQYFIETTDDGKKYVRADRQVIRGNDPRSWGEQVENYINGKIRHGEDVQLLTEDGDVLTLTRTSAGKLASRYDGKGKTLSENSYETKLNAAAHIDELAQVSKRSRSSADQNQRHGNFASRGWDYRTAYFMDFDGAYYSLDISVAKNDNGNIVYNIGNVQKRKFPRALNASNGSSATGGAQVEKLSTDSIRDSGENSKPNYSQQESAAWLRAQNQRLREQVERLQTQLRTTQEAAPRAEDVKKLARRLTYDYSSLANEKQLVNDLDALGRRLMGRNASYSDVKEGAVNIARELIQNAETLQNGEMAELYSDIRGQLRKPMVISQRDARSVSPEWGQWRNANKGLVNVSINGKGTPVDTVYSELSAAHPEFFPAEVANPADMVLTMLDAAEALEPVYANPYDRNMAEAIEYAANDILDSLLGPEVRQAEPTVADWKRRGQAAERALEKERARGEARLQRERERGAEALRRNNEWARGEARLQRERERGAEAQRRNNEWARDAVAKAREQRDNAIARIRDEQRRNRENARKWRAENADRQKLLNVARRLERYKTTRANRAVINELTGDLDTVAVRLTGQRLESLETLDEFYRSKSDPESDNYDPDFIPDPRALGDLARLRKKQIQDLDIEDVRDLTEALLNLENELRESKRLIDSEDRRDVYQMGEQVIRDINNTRGSRAGNAIDEFIVTETLSPEREIRRITGYDENDGLFEGARVLEKPPYAHRR